MEQEIILKKDQVERAVDALIQLRNKTKNKSLLADTDKVLVTFSVKKIPKVTSTLHIPIHLPHSAATKTSDVCLIVKDIDRDDRDYDNTVEYYRGLLDKHGVTQVTQITPLKSIKIENQPYEMKRRFALMYDVFLADSRIVRFLPRLLGKDFLKHRSFVQVDLTRVDIKKAINKGLHKTQCVVTGTGSTCCVAVANVKMSHAGIVDNVISAVRAVTHRLPGGPRNVRSVQIKTPDSMSIPVYYSHASANEVTVPVVKDPANQFYMKPERITTMTKDVVQFTAPMKFKVIPREFHSSDESESDDEVVEEEPCKKRRRRSRKRKNVANERLEGDVQDSEKKLEEDEEKKPVVEPNRVKKPRMKGGHVKMVKCDSVKRTVKV